MKKAYCLGILLFALLFHIHNAFAQSGTFFMTHYAHNSESLDNANFDIVQDNQGVINIANRAGILRFDGNNWEHLYTPAAIFSLSLDDNSNTIYGGGIGGFGKVIYTEADEWHYQLISDSTMNEKVITKTLLQDNILYGLGDNVVYAFDLKTSQISQTTSKYAGLFYNIHALDNQIAVSTENSGLQLLNGNKLEDFKIDGINNLNIEFIASQPNSTQKLIGTSSNDLFLLNKNTLTQLKIKDEDEYLKRSDIIDGIWVNDSLSALASIKGGVIFIDHKKNEISQIVNYQSGLPDNEIFSFSTDSHGGIWVAHSGGFTRISPHLPFRSFNYYEGLEGHILSVINHQDSLYVGTSLGLYKLQKVKNYEQIDVVEKTRIEVETPVEETKEEKKGFLGLFKKKTETPKQTKKTSRVVYRSSTRQELKSISYRFEQVKPINSKVLHFASYGDKLFAAGLDGLYEVSGPQAKTITTEAIKYFAVAEKSGVLVASTYDNLIKTYSLSGNYKEVGLFYDFRDQVQHIFEDASGRIWFSSNDELYYITIDSGEIFETNNYPIDNPYLYKTLGSDIEGIPTFINESGKLTFDEKAKKFVTSVYPTQRHLVGANGEVWIFNEDNWHLLNEISQSDQLNLLSLFKDIAYISTDDVNNHWVVTKNNDLYRISNKEQGLTGPYELFLKFIKTDNRTVAPKPNMKFDQSNSSFLFQFAQPEYSGILDVKYQYKLEGLSDNWSDWSGNYNIVSFPYLPEGEYKLKMRSKDILGKITEIDPIEFEIVPPYWKRPWFYAFEFTALALLLFVSVRLKKFGFKYRLVSRLLALITLIIIIEFIQTVAENEFGSESSPVFDFLIQVTIAIIVLPVESLIRKFIFREKNVQILDFIQLKDKSVS